MNDTHRYAGHLTCSCGKVTSTQQGLATHMSRLNNAAKKPSRDLRDLRDALVNDAVQKTGEEAKHDRTASLGFAHWKEIPTVDAYELAYLRAQDAMQKANRDLIDARYKEYAAQLAVEEAQRVRQDCDAAQSRALEQWTEARDALSVDSL